jgi:hypothetical protein
MPFIGADSWREPRLTQMPIVAERRPGICSVRIVAPFGSLVDLTCWDIYFLKLLDFTFGWCDGLLRL